jgi:hypothetical protein
MLSFLPVAAAMLASVRGAVIHGSFNGNMSLPCGHAEPDPSYVRWRYTDKYSRAQHLVIEQAGAEADPEYGKNFSANRILAWDYASGNIRIAGLGCWEDQTYICELFSGPVVEHTVVLGKLRWVGVDSRM